MQRCSYVDVHGTSYLVEMIDRVGSPNGPTEPYPPQAFGIGEDEQLLGYYDLRYYQSFQSRCSILAEHAVNTVEEFRNTGYKIVGYGAAAKGVVFINATRTVLDYVIDDNPLKQGKFIPGRNIHVAAPDALGQPGKTLFVILAWNMKDEIIGKIRKARPQDYPRFKGDRFLTCFPSVELTI